MLFCLVTQLSYVNSCLLCAFPMVLFITSGKMMKVLPVCCTVDSTRTCICFYLKILSFMFQFLEFRGFCIITHLKVTCEWFDNHSPRVHFPVDRCNLFSFSLELGRVDDK